MVAAGGIRIGKTFHSMRKIPVRSFPMSAEAAGEIGISEQVIRCTMLIESFYGRGRWKWTRCWIVGERRHLPAFPSRWGHGTKSMQHATVAIPAFVRTLDANFAQNGRKPIATWIRARKCICCVRSKCMADVRVRKRSLGPMSSKRYGRLSSISFSHG